MENSGRDPRVVTEVAGDYVGEPSELVRCAESGKQQPAEPAWQLEIQERDKHLPRRPYRPPEARTEDNDGGGDYPGITRSRRCYARTGAWAANDSCHGPDDQRREMKHQDRQHSQHQRPAGDEGRARAAGRVRGVATPQDSRHPAHRLIEEERPEPGALPFCGRKTGGRGIGARRVQERPDQRPATCGVHAHAVTGHRQDERVAAAQRRRRHLGPPWRGGRVELT